MLLSYLLHDIVSSNLSIFKSDDAYLFGLIKVNYVSNITFQNKTFFERISINTVSFLLIFATTLVLIWVASWSCVLFNLLVCKHFPEFIIGDRQKIDSFRHYVL